MYVIDSEILTIETLATSRGIRTTINDSTCLLLERKDIGDLAQPLVDIIKEHKNGTEVAEWVTDKAVTSFRRVAPKFEADDEDSICPSGTIKVKFTFFFRNHPDGSCTMRVHTSSTDGGLRDITATYTDEKLKSICHNSLSAIKMITVK